MIGCMTALTTSSIDCIFSHQINLQCDSALDLINYALDGTLLQGV